MNPCLLLVHYCAAYALAAVEEEEVDMHVGSARPRNLLSSCPVHTRRACCDDDHYTRSTACTACFSPCLYRAKSATVQHNKNNNKLNKYALLVTTVVTDALYVAWPHACVLQSMRVLLRRFDPVPHTLHWSASSAFRQARHAYGPDLLNAVQQPWSSREP